MIFSEKNMDAIYEHVMTQRCYLLQFHPGPGNSRREVGKRDGKLFPSPGNSGSMVRTIAT